MIGKRWLGLGALGLLLIVNPQLACSHGAGGDFDYSEEEMQRVVLGTWQGSARWDGESVPFALTLEQARAKERAPLGAQQDCASRSFVKPAAACIALTRMPVVGTLTSEHPSFNGAVDGAFVAYRTLKDVELSLHVEGGAILSGKVEGDAVKDGRISAQLRGAFSLQRP